MIRSFVIALALAVVAPAALPMDLCEGPCAVTLDFPDGGSISAPDGATITFGPEGGEFALGDGGSIDFGEGGGSATLEGGPGNMSQGGTVVLGTGGSIQFGPAGRLQTGDAGAIAATGVFQVSAAGAVTIASEQSVRFGDLESHGNIELRAQGDVNGCDTETPLHFAMAVDNPDTAIVVTSGDDIGMGKFKGAPTIDVTAGGNATLCADAPPGDGGTGGSGGSAGDAGGVIIYSNGTYYDGRGVGDGSGGNLQVDCEGCELAVSAQPLGRGEGSGAPSPSALLLLGLAALGRRRR